MEPTRNENERAQDELRQADEELYRACKDLINKPEWQIFRELVMKRSRHYEMALSRWNMHLPDSKEKFIAEQAKYRETLMFVGMMEDGAVKKVQSYKL